MKATMRTGTARRNSGSALNSRRYAGLAMDCASPLIESERKDALAVSARAIASLRSDDPRQFRKMCRIPPNHSDKNRCAAICRESAVNIF
jgi:hypothetical protein